MTKEAFAQEILCHLREQLERYPCMEPQDLVKFVFQAMLGVGHLLSSRDAVENYVIRETEQLSPGKPLKCSVRPGAGSACAAQKKKEFHLPSLPA